MAAPQFEANRQTDLTVYLNRLLEKCYKDSKCIDLESLCIVVEEKVILLNILPLPDEISVKTSCCH